MADQILTGQKVETNGTMTFNNGKLTIPSYPRADITGRTSSHNMWNMQ